MGRKARERLYVFFKLPSQKNYSKCAATLTQAAEMTLITAAAQRRFRSARDTHA